MPGPFGHLDVICARRQAFKYVSPPFCEVDFSSTGEPVIVLSPFRRRRGPTGFRAFSGARIRFRWGTVPGAICFSLYKREGDVFVLVAECFPCEPCEDAAPDECCYECETCAPGCYALTAITEDGETELSNEACTEGCTVEITTASPLPPGNFNAPYSQQLDQEFGVESTEQWSLVAGALPAGLTLSPSGLISGTPTDGGPFNFTAGVEAMCTEQTGGAHEKAFLLNIQGGPEPTCILRIQDYGTVTQPLFIGHPDSPVSTDPEWDGVWNLLEFGTYWYQGANGFHEFPSDDPDPRIGPDIAVGGRGVSYIRIEDAGGYWQLSIFYFPVSDVVKRTWLGRKIGGDVTSPVGVYINQMLPGESTSDPRLSVTVEICP